MLLTKSKIRKNISVFDAVAMRMFWYSNTATVNVYRVS